MKVICTNHKDYTGDEFHGPRPEIGDECEVVEPCLGRGTKGVIVACYRLAGYGSEWVYDQRNFSPISDICEVEMLEERADQEIAQLDEAFRDLVHEFENA